MIALFGFQFRPLVHYVSLRPVVRVECVCDKARGLSAGSIREQVVVEVIGAVYIAWHAQR